MKIYYVSNLHLDLKNFHSFTPDPEGILLVAGDTIPTEYIQSENFDAFLKLASEFEKCIFVLGELEHYNAFYEATYLKFLTKLKSLFPHKFCLLENEHLKLNDTTYIFGSTFWTKNPKRNEYSYIKTRDGVIDENTVVGLNKETCYHLNSFCKEMPSKNIIVLSHFPPDIDLIGQNTNITHWVYGHAYNKIKYTLDQCEIFCNPNEDLTSYFEI